jgi:methylenetetrahydrofolate--tRNA-(uracil-5-)-methyltransferase
LDQYYRLRKTPCIRFAGQITGVEGYVESAASGLMCGVYAALEAEAKLLPELDNATAVGALGLYVSSAPAGHYQPMNINFGIMQPPDGRIRNREERNNAISARALEKLRGVKERYHI